MTINVHIFERSEALQECVEHLILWGRRDTELAHRMNYRTFVQPAAPFIDSVMQVSELSPGVVEVSFYDGRLPEDIRYSAKGLAMYAKLEELPGDRTRIHLSCAIDEFIPHWEQLLADFGQTLSPEAGPDVPGVAGQGAKGDELLTEREREVVQLLAQGKSQNEIAEKLVMTEGTVRTHKQNIAEKWQTGTAGHKVLQIEARRRGYA